MLSHFGEQADRLVGGLIGATLGVVFSISQLSWGFSAIFLFTFFALFFAQSLPRHLLRYDPRGARRAFLLYLVFLGMLIVAFFYFGHLMFWEDGWSRQSVEPRLALVLIALLFASLVTIIPLLLMDEQAAGAQQ